jgi:uncharacterized protein YbaA (DUF1428 family)
LLSFRRKGRDRRKIARGIPRPEACRPGIISKRTIRRRTMTYVDGFVLAVPKKNVETYKQMARDAGKVWMEHGALAYQECLGDDLPYGDVTSFPRAVQATDDETVVFAWVVYESRSRRDEVLKKVLDDPRMKNGMDNMPFDAKRMIYGGFETFLQL